MGSEHPDIAELYILQGDICMHLSKFQEMISCYETSLRLRIKIYGEEHYFTADSLEKLGIAHRILGNFGSALECHEAALRIKTVKFGEEHVAIADTLIYLG